MSEETIFLGLAAGIQRFVELFIKPAVNQLGLSEGASKLLTLAGSIVVSLIVSFGSTTLNILTMFDGYNTANPLVGRIITAFVLAGGSALVNEVFNFRRALQGQPPVIVTPPDSGASSTVVTNKVNDAGTTTTVTQQSDDVVGYVKDSDDTASPVYRTSGRVPRITASSKEII